jgi:hypothetical protein
MSMSQTLTGRCLCGQVRYTAVGEPVRFYHCHCSRCRHATGTGHASNLFVQGTLSFESGEDRVRRFKPPDAERFTNTFCEVCGGRVPRANGPMVFIPAGSLDVEPELLPQARIYMGSRASWSCSALPLPEFETLAS